MSGVVNDHWLQMLFPDHCSPTTAMDDVNSKRKFVVGVNKESGE